MEAKLMNASSEKIEKTSNRRGAKLELVVNNQASQKPSPTEEQVDHNVDVFLRLFRQVGEERQEAAKRARRQED